MRGDGVPKKRRPVRRDVLLKILYILMWLVGRVPRYVLPSGQPSSPSFGSANIFGPSMIMRLSTSPNGE